MLAEHERVPTKSYIPNGHKYAFVSIPNERDVVGTDTFSIGEGYWATNYIPVAMPDHWQEWLGTFRSNELHKASIFLGAMAPSAQLEDLDDENVVLRERAHRLYFGAMIACTGLSHSGGVSATGSVHFDGRADIRQTRPYEATFRVPGAPRWVGNTMHLRTAARIASGIERFRAESEADRIWRITHAYYDGLKSNQAGVRLHQFVRCIEGLNLVTRTSETLRATFLSRTALFIGHGHRKLLGEVWEIRCGVEHLDGPLARIDGNSIEEKRLMLSVGAYAMEAVARDCLTRVFTVPELQTHFSSKERLKAFWTDLDDAARRELWGAPLPIRAVIDSFNTDEARYWIARED